MNKKFLKKQVEELKTQLRTYGYIVPKNAKFYYSKKHFEVGMKVGEYSHSCHVDSTDFVILLFFNTTTHEVYSEDGPLTTVKKLDI